MLKRTFTEVLTPGPPVAEPFGNTPRPCRPMPHSARPDYWTRKIECLKRTDILVGLRASVAEELPGVADLLDLVEVEVGDDEFRLVA